MNSRLDSYQKKVDKAKAEKAVLTKTLVAAKIKRRKLAERLFNTEKARGLIQKVAQETQSQLEFHISGLVTMALQSVSSEWPSLKISFVPRRNKTECDIVFTKGEEEMQPLLSSGGGPIDVAAFALRAAFWSLSKTRPVLILDEPFKYVSVDLQPTCSEMLKTISEKLNVQIIMVSHLPEIISCADKIIEIKNGQAVT